MFGKLWVFWLFLSWTELFRVFNKRLEASLTRIIYQNLKNFFIISNFSKLLQAHMYMQYSNKLGKDFLSFFNWVLHWVLMKVKNSSFQSWNNIWVLMKIKKVRKSLVFALQVHIYFKKFGSTQKKFGKLWVFLSFGLEFKLFLLKISISSFTLAYFNCK